MNIEQKILGEMCFGEELVVLDLAATWRLWTRWPPGCWRRGW